MNLDDVRRSRAAENQSIFRTVNEHIHNANPDSGDASAEGRFVCECTKLDCTELLPLTMAAYEAVRANPTHFIVAPDPSHFIADVERIVERAGHYWVLEKIGAAAERAEELADTI